MSPFFRNVLPELVKYNPENQGDSITIAETIIKQYQNLGFLDYHTSHETYHVNFKKVYDMPAGLEEEYALFAEIADIVPNKNQGHLDYIRECVSFVECAYMWSEQAGMLTGERTAPKSEIRESPVTHHPVNPYLVSGLTMFSVLLIVLIPEASRTNSLPELFLSLGVVVAWIGLLFMWSYLTSPAITQDKKPVPKDSTQQINPFIIQDHYINQPTVNQDEGMVNQLNVRKIK